MRRRSFLRTVGGVAALAVAGTAGAHPTDSGTGTPPHEDAPDPLGSLTVDDAAEAVVGGDDLVYLAVDDGFLVVDADDPADFRTLSTTREVLADRENGPIRSVQDVAVEGDRLLLVGPAFPDGDAVSGAVLFDVSDPAAPERVAFHETDFPIHNGYLSDGLAYLTGYGDGNPLVVVDVADGEVGRWSLFDRDDAWRDVPIQLRWLHDVTVHDDLAYLAYWDAGTWLLDVSDPSSPEYVSKVRGRSPEELADADASRESAELPGNDHFATVGPDGDLLGVNEEAWAADEGSERGPGGIEFYDVSDPTDPVRLSRIDPPPTPDPTRSGVWTTAHNFALTADRCYSSWYQGGVKVHDLSDPENPEELYHWRDADRTRFWTAQPLPSGEAFVASSMGVEGEDGTPGGLFAFPDPDPEPETATPRPTTDSTPGRSGATGDGVSVGLLGLGAAALGAWSRFQGEN